MTSARLAPGCPSGDPPSSDDRLDDLTIAHWATGDPEGYAAALAEDFADDWAAVIDRLIADRDWQDCNGVGHLARRMKERMEREISGCVLPEWVERWLENRSKR